VSEQKLLQQLPRIEGQIDQPNERERVLMHPPAAMDYFHEVILHWLGAIVILGMITALGAAYLFVGGCGFQRAFREKVPRFNAFERFSHWLTAYPSWPRLDRLEHHIRKILLLPVIGPEAFSSMCKSPSTRTISSALVRYRARIDCRRSG